MLSDDLIAKIGDGLDAMPPRPASRIELDLLLGRIATKIRTAQERGATYAEIAKQISDSGYPVKTSTLRLALQRHRKNELGAKPARKSRRTKKPAASKPVVKTPTPTPPAAPPAQVKKPEHA
ncbi:MAG TPA: hypothetical protein VMA98_09335 [Candidatus Acidoferrales bacterium]|nr:hypothetical protein [Candidatus Acidoferrales bacterium]